MTRSKNRFFTPVSTGAYCEFGGAECTPVYIETVEHADLQCPRVVHDIRRTAYETGQMYQLRAENVLPFLLEEARSHTSVFIDQYGSETDPESELIEAFGIACHTLQHLQFFDEAHERQAIAWLNMMFCTKPPVFSKTPPRMRFPAYEGEYLRTTATVLRGISPEWSALWGLCYGYNDNTP